MKVYLVIDYQKKKKKKKKKQDHKSFLKFFDTIL